MTKKEKKNTPESILERLKHYSRINAIDSGLVITNYAIERLLFRLSISRFSSSYILKGAQLFRISIEQGLYRPTRDLDLLKLGSSDISDMENVFKEICEIESNINDGIEFHKNTVRGEVIRESNMYKGVRIKLRYNVSKATEHIQIDIGFGDAVNPPARKIIFPSILGMPVANILAYNHETVIAEKIEAMVSIGYFNSRMKDFYDVYQLCCNFNFDGNVLAESICDTFNRRKTPIPNTTPVAFTESFYSDQLKQQQWKAFLNKIAVNNLQFIDVVETIKVFIMPTFKAVIEGQGFPSVWRPDSGWESRDIS